MTSISIFQEAYDKRYIRVILYRLKVLTNTKVELYRKSSSKNFRRKLRNSCATFASNFNFITSYVYWNVAKLEIFIVCIIFMLYEVLFLLHMSYFCYMFNYTFIIYSQGGRGQRAPPLFFAITCLFCNQFEELQTVLFEAEQVINNALLTCFYPNTIETCLTPNHLLFGRQLLYFSNTTSTVVKNLTVLSSTTDKINRISNHFFGQVETWICSKFT